MSFGAIGSMAEIMPWPDGHQTFLMHWLNQNLRDAETNNAARVVKYPAARRLYIRGVANGTPVMYTLRFTKEEMEHCPLVDRMKNDGSPF